MKAEIWHAKHPTFMDSKPRKFPDEFTHVADLDVADREEAFHDSNNLDRDWTKNSSVLKVHVPTPLRSTSVGDVVLIPGRGTYLCQSVGWKLLDGLDSN